MTSKLSSTEMYPTYQVLISCETVSYINIRKKSYLSDNLKDNEVLKDGTSSMIDSVGRFTKVTMGNFSTSVGCEKICNTRTIKHLNVLNLDLFCIFLNFGFTDNEN